MYEVDNEIDEEKETLKGILLQWKLSLKPTTQTHKKVSRDRHEEQLLQQHVADLNTRAQQMKASHIEALQAVRMRDPATWSELRMILIIRRKPR